jgi:uncharacterized protein YkwD
VTGRSQLPSKLAPFAAVFAGWLCLSPVACAAPADEIPRAAGQRSSCGGSGETGAARDAVVAWITARRAEDGLAPFDAQPVLCRVAQERAEQVARAASVDSTAATVSRVSRRLLAAGYAAHLWTERAILGYREPADMVRVWSETSGAGESSFEKTVLGDFEDLGVGVAPGDGGTAVVLIFATPRSSWFREQVRPLEDLAAVRGEALARVNRAREEEHRSPVTADPELDRAAQAHADDMIERGYYGHVSPQKIAPRDWVEQTGYPPFSFLAENIAKGLFTPTEAVERWLDSPHHRRNILDPRSRETGLGVAWGEVDGELQVIWVQLFAKPR